MAGFSDQCYDHTSSVGQTWWNLSDLNRPPPECKTGALPDELRPHLVKLDLLAACSRRFWRERRESNPLKPDPQSGAAPFGFSPHNLELATRLERAESWLQTRYPAIRVSPANLERPAGFEPALPALATQGLTTWLRPQTLDRELWFQEGDSNPIRKWIQSPLSCR